MNSRTKSNPILLLLLWTAVFFASMGHFTAYSQEKDSLIQLLSDAKGKQKLEILFKLSELTSQTEEGIKFAEEALAVAKKMDRVSLIEAYENMAIAYSENFLDEAALSYFKKAYQLSLEYGYIPGLLKACKGISTSYFYLDSINLSTKYSNELLAAAEKVDSLNYEADAYFWLGRIKQAEGQTDSALMFIGKALKLREKLGNLKEVAQTYNGLGGLYFDDAQYEKAIECYKKEIEIKEAIHDKPDYLALAYLNLGRAHIALSNFQLALEQYQKALRTFESINNEKGIAVSNSGIGMIYENLSQSVMATEENEVNYTKALEYHKNALRLFRKMGQRKEEGQTLQNIGNVFSRLATNRFVARFGEEWEDSLYKIKQDQILASFDSSLIYYQYALDIFNQINDEREIVKVNTNLGSTYSWARDWPKATRYISQAVGICRRNGYQYELSAALYAQGESYYRQGNLAGAEASFLECVEISTRLGLKETLRYSYNRLSKLYEQKGDMAKALANLKLSVRIKDEIFTEKSQKIITEMQTKYETEKKEQELKLMKNQDELQKSIIQRQKLMIIGAIVGALLILMVALLMFKMFRDKQRANRILQEKNALITSQKKEITDSIQYASRIQSAVLPTSSLLAEALPEHFVLFKPRDIVSGDFYWMTRKNEKVVLVAADCTGHGVPGAFMSMLGVSFLYEIVNKENVLQPAEILNQLRIHIKTTLSQTGKQNEQKDGMDISLCVIDRPGNVLEWAGAYNSLYQIRGGELTEYKADKMPVAVHVSDSNSFTNHQIEIQHGDTFYMFSDGYADQFGGTDGKKFMSKKFKELLVGIWNKPMDEQGKIINETHLQWKGEYDQVDDILVIGFRV
ncbi:MAG TPA: tetratricopeptide repeat protein [Tenuifilaceae bacterium]|nr:tetratricopeptide repeat protein [Tenuifilaceae bacterium]